MGVIIANDDEWMNGDSWLLVAIHGELLWELLGMWVFIYLPS